MSVQLARICCLVVVVVVDAAQFVMNAFYELNIYYYNSYNTADDEVVPHAATNDPQLTNQLTEFTSHGV